MARLQERASRGYKMHDFGGLPLEGGGGKESEALLSVSISCKLMCFQLHFHSVFYMI